MPSARGTWPRALGWSRAHLVHISTDYVFDGTSSLALPGMGPAQPDVRVRPVEIGRRARSAIVGPGASVVRSSWICGRFGHNMVKTILRMASSGAPLRFVDDQRGCPTFAGDLAAMVVRLAIARSPGVFHVTNQGPTSWFGFARDVLVAAGHGPGQGGRRSRHADLDPPRPAPRPG